MDRVKKKNFFIIFSLTLLLFLGLLISNSGILTPISIYFLNGKESIFNSDVGMYFESVESITFFKYFGVELKNIRSTMSFESSLTYALSLFQLILPFIVSLTGLRIFDFHNKIGSMIYYRKDKFRSFYLKNVVRTSLEISLSIFSAFSVYFIICLVLFGGRYDAYHIETDFLLDILGNNFYYRSIHLYYFVLGIVQFFFIPFVLSFFSGTLPLVFSNKKLVAIGPLVYYFGLAVLTFPIISLFSRSGNMIGLLLNPSAIMAVGDYTKVPSLLMLLSNSIPLLLGLFIIFYGTGSKHVEV